MREKDCEFTEEVRYYARSRVGTTRISKVWEVNPSLDYSEREKQILRLPSGSTNDYPYLKLMGFLAKSSGYFHIEIQTNRTHFAYGKISVLDPDGKPGTLSLTLCQLFVSDYVNHCPNFIPKRICGLAKLMSLLCDFTTFTGFDHQTIDEVNHIRTAHNPNLREPNQSTIEFESKVALCRGSCDRETQTEDDEGEYQDQKVVESSPAEESLGCLREDLLYLYDGKKFCDLTLRAGGQTFPVHKTVLCARSSRFRDLLGMDFSGKREKSYKNREIEEKSANKASGSKSSEKKAALPGTDLKKDSVLMTWQELGDRNDLERKGSFTFGQTPAAFTFTLVKNNSGISPNEKSAATVAPPSNGKGSSFEFDPHRSTRGSVSNVNYAAKSDESDDLGLEPVVDDKRVAETLTISKNELPFEDGLVRPCTVEDGHEAEGQTTKPLENVKKAKTKSEVTDILEITDIDAETLKLLLDFMYSDDLEDGVDAETASKLYLTSVQYGLSPLREKCLYAVESDLSESNVCAVLELSDCPVGGEVRELAENFFIRRAKGVLGLDAWKRMMADRPQFASQLMYKFCLQKTE